MVGLFNEYSFSIVEKVSVLSLFLILGASIGWCFETCFYRVNDGKFVRRGHGYGPWLPIYGLGGIFILLTTYTFIGNPLYIFLISSIVAGVIEYFTGWYLYTYHNGLRLWDYNIEKWNFGNIKGYICFRSIFGFGIAGLFADLFLFPFLCKIAVLASSRLFCIVSLLLLVLFILDIVNGYFLNNLEE